MCVIGFECVCVSVTEKAMAAKSSTLAWKILWTEETVGCSPRGHKESDTTEPLHFHFSLSYIGEVNGSLFTFIHWRSKWQHTPVFVPGESQGRQSLVGCLL